MTAGSNINAGKAKHLGRALRLWRTVRRVKQTHAAQLLGVSQPTLSRWENGASVADDGMQTRIGTLLATGLDSAADHALARLVSSASAEVHLVCDVTHRLLAASPARRRQFSAPLDELLGRSLWPFASEDIVAAEASLGDYGWFEPAPAPYPGSTREQAGRLVFIPESRFLWTRLRLSDGGFARLVETLTPDPAPLPNR